MFQEDFSAEDVALHPDSLPQRPSPPPPPLQPLPPPRPPPEQPTFPEPLLCIVPLRRWIASEAARGGRMLIQQNKLSMIRKTTIAYAIAELLHHLKRHRRPGPDAARLSEYDKRLSEECGLDNFVVRVADSSHTAIKGVDMISPATSLRVISPYFLSDEFFDGATTSNDANDNEAKKEELGRYLEVEIQSNTDAAAVYCLGSSEENTMCYLLGVLLYELFSGAPPFSASNEEMQAKAPPATRNSMDEPSRKKTFSESLSFKEKYNAVANDSSLASKGNGASFGEQLKEYLPLKDLGFPSSLSLLVKNLLDCGWSEFRPDDAMPSLKVASSDLHLLLQEPNRFMFDRNPDRGGGLDVKQNKLYGRDSERSLITEAFCNVSLTGRGEALFIEGFSGSGKSKLVESVFGHVEVTGGYAIRRKFHQILQERPMSAVIAAFNDLCPMISAKRSHQELTSIANELMALFGSHLSMLARVLPNATLLSPELNTLSSHEQQQNTEINLNRVYFILQLFMRVVSSKSHPVMLFLDDLQWADGASLDVLKYVLSELDGSSCVYFVGSYRSNEAPSNHAIFRFMGNLVKSGVHVKRIHLDGMKIDDVNHITSDSLGMFPRTCMPLSRLVFRKTKGNPLFVLECLRSLVDRGLLQYSLRERCWLWDMEKIAAEDIADNVCELFFTKMMGLPESSQSALKIASCFGNAIDSTVVTALMSNPPAFCTLQNELEKAVEAGFMNKDCSGSAYRFVHDKVQEAAYGLIEDENKHPFHHSIGKFLYHATQGQNVNQMIFIIANQINHGDILDPDLRVDIADLNRRAASRAMWSSNFDAAYFYSNTAIKFLPQDHWESNYDLSRSIFLVLGNAAYTAGHIKEASSVLDEILSHGKSLEDRLDAYSLKISLLNACQECKHAYDVCVEVLEAL